MSPDLADRLGARLIVLDPTSPVILASALLNGFLANPIFYLWLGLTLMRGRST